MNDEERKRYENAMLEIERNEKVTFICIIISCICILAQCGILIFR